MARLHFVRNLIAPGKTEPTLYMGKFAAGASVAIARGDLLELTGTGNTEFVPLDSDYDMSGGDLAVAAEDVRSGDRAGYYRIWLIAPGDIWEVEIAASGTRAPGTNLYYSAKNKLTVSAGTNIVAACAGDEHIPHQGHLSVDASPDAGTTLQSAATARVIFQASNSYYSRLQTA